MSLRVVTGAANTGKTGRAFSIFRDAVGQGLDAWLLLPTQLDVERATNELAEEFPLGLRVGTFHAHLSHVWSRDGDGRRIITEAQRSLLLSGAVSSCNARPSLAVLASRCIEQLADQTGERWRRGLERPHPAAVALADVIALYARELDRLCFIEASEALHALGARGRAPADVLVVHRFSGLTDAQSVYLRGASRDSDVWVTVIWKDGFVPTAASERVLEALAPDEILAEEGVTFHTTGALRVLSEGLFGEKTEPVSRDDSVRFVLAEGAEAQAHAVAREVARALADGTATSPGDVAVVMRKPEPHFNYLERAFRDAGIHASWNVPARFASSVFGGAVLDVLDHASGADRAPLERLLRSPYSGCSGERARLIELGWRRFGAPRARVVRDLEVHARGLANVLTTATKAAQSPLTPDSCAALASALESLYALGCRIGTRAGAADDGRALSAAVEWLSDAAVLRGGGVSVSDMRRALEEAPLSASGPEYPERVHVTSALAVRGRRFGTVILMGLNAGELPGEPDEMMASAGAVGGLLAANGVRADTRTHDAAERMLFYELITRARARLVLIGRSSDDEGEALTLSPFWEEAADTFATAESRRELIDEYVTMVALGEGDSGRLRSRVTAVHASTPQAHRARARAARRVGRLERAPAAAAFDRDVISPSEIEAYVRCPYRWFIDFAIRPAELDREFGVRDEGDYAHQLLAGAYRSLARNGYLPLDARSQPQIEAALETTAFELTEESAAALSFSEQIGRARAASWARRILREDACRESPFVPAYFEWDFNGSDWGLVIEGVALRGRADRVDVDDQGRAIIVDYKRNVGTSIQAAKLVSHAHLQGLLYLEAIRLSLGLSPAGALYRGLARAQQRGVLSADVDYGGGIIRTDRRELVELEGMIDTALRTTADAILQMRAGDIEPNPVSSQACMYCRAAIGCGRRLQ